MDFKVAGTRAGVTALQLDTKLPGLPLKWLVDALAPARAARVSSDEHQFRLHIRCLALQFRALRIVNHAPSCLAGWLLGVLASACAAREY